MIRLAARVSIGGGKESTVRLVLTALGVALGVTLLLIATVAFPALHAHDARSGWTDTSEHNRRPSVDESTSDALLWRLTDDEIGSRPIIRVDVAAEGSHAPVPSFLDRLPGPGELAASPAMERLLESTDRSLLADRYPGRVVETVGNGALEAPNQLVIFVGYTPAALHDAGAITVHSIETAPKAHTYADTLKLVFVIGALALLIPLLVFVSTATRLAAARREQRLAAMRLAGATPAQAGAVAAVEALVAGIVGTAVGFVGFVLLRPYAAHLPIDDGMSFYRSDLHLSLAFGVLIAVGVPLLAALAALVSLRRVRISPLGVTRQAVRRRPRGWRVLALVGSLVVFALSLAFHSGSYGATSTLVTIGAAFSLIVLSIVVCGPWLTVVVAKVMQRFGRRAPSLLAARRLEDNPSAGFRAISGLVLAVFVTSLVSSLAASHRASVHFGHASIADTTVGAVAASQSRAVPVGSSRDLGTLDATAASRLLDALQQIPGVTRVIDVRTVPGGVPIQAPRRFADGEVVKVRLPDPGVVRCTDAAALGLSPCVGTTTVDVGAILDRGSPPAATLGRVVSPAELTGQSLWGVAVLTNGHFDTIEHVRTDLERAFPGSQAMTGTDINAVDRRELSDAERLTNIALLVTLLIAGCSLAVAVAGGLVERKRPFALLRLSGMPLRQLHRVVLAEAAWPLLVVAAASAVLGFVVNGMLLAIVNSNQRFRFPAPSYWLTLGGGLAIALAIVGATLPLLDRLTSLETARFE
ncbi:MAG TPA: FtsX-like permease family protein [Acidimicrobiia bacterium]|nr:FtsX-like permease family protein [Acidimicrobiia bacterium]